MRYEQIPNTLFIKNRQKLIDELKKDSLVVLSSNAVLPTNADGVMGFKQNSNLFYLSGIDQEDTFVVLMPNHPKDKFREVVFIRETNEHLKIWEGEKLTKSEARLYSGIKTVKWSWELEKFIDKNACFASHCYLDFDEKSEKKTEFISKPNLFYKWFKKTYKPKKCEKIAPILSKLRSIKEPEEVELIKKAISITQLGLNSFVKKLQPKVYEYQLEAELTGQFLLNRSRGHAFPPIIASGGNACVLHYVTNNEKCEDGELILLDFGAEYGNYNADITRCFPVNGKFSKRQAEVYNAVLRVFKFSKERLIAGNTMNKLKKETATLVEQELIGLGLITQVEIDNQDLKKPAFKKYFPHGVSHYLGLDVHDVGPKDAKFKAGMVFTCEPGIYIPEEGIGIRLENDILITEDGNLDLAEDIPIEIADIEALTKH